MQSVPAHDNGVEGLEACLDRLWPSTVRLRRSAAWLTIAIAVAWMAGFGWFVDDALQPATPPPPADGIVVLTGGADRVGTALRLLADGRARLLLVSGVAPETTLASLAERAGFAPGPLPGTLAERITLGRLATTTVGNAAEAAAWARRFDMHALIVVTASYHMRRAMIEIGRALPGVRLVACPVLPAALREGGPHIIRLLAGEYTKWLLAWLGLDRLQRG